MIVDQHVATLPRQLLVGGGVNDGHVVFHVRFRRPLNVSTIRFKQDGRSFLETYFTLRNK